MAEYRGEALDRLDILAFFASQGVQLRKLNATEYRFLCPFHDDKDPSANVAISGPKKGTWFCHACGAKGSPIDFVMQREGKTFREALTIVGGLAGMDPPSVARKANGHTDEAPTPAVRPAKLTEENVESWHRAALRHTDLMRWFEERRGFDLDTVVRWKLGWDGERVTIPVREADGTLVNVRRYKRDSTGTQGKMLSIAAGAGAARLFPLVLPLPSEVILVEGEWDALLMIQRGFTNTLTVTSGAGIWPDDATELFTGKRVVICYDNDEAGRSGATKVAAKLLPVAESVRIANIDGLPDKGDVTDFFVEYNRSPDELRSIFDDAKPYLQPAVVREEKDPVVVPLYQASNSMWQGQRLALPVLLSGKGMTPFTIPYAFTAKCDMGNKKLCGICPLKLSYNGHREVQLSAADPAVLSLVNVPDTTMYTAMKKLAGAVTACGRPQFEVTEHINVEELRLIPEIDSTSNAETEYVARTGYYLGHGSLPNRGYTGVGYTHPHPKTQATVHVLSELIPAQDNISAFLMTPALNRELAVFTTSDIRSKTRDIYDDFARNVHRIQDRYDMQVAYDLVWHSVTSFYFNGAYVRRGWAECLVMGDSGQGKTEMAMELIRHYGLGRRVQGEQTSQAGLIGGLEKMGDAWILSWGAGPQNDRRLLVVDETQGLASEQIEAMSDVRATGVAEITKIRTERTNARCRIVWLANPVSGVPLAGFNQGVLAVKELFRKPEDIRRLDFAITVATGDVNITKVNALHNASGEPRYSSKLCRSLILWAWSRTPEQVHFSPSAVDRILAAATDMGRRYHASIPLVEPADQRLKLARLSAAAAARVYSTDDGTNVLVTSEHVDFVVDFLNRIYAARSMSYAEYSDQMRGQETLGDEERVEVVEELRRLTNADEALAFFRTARVFKKADLVDVVGWDDAYAKMQVRWLSHHRLVTQAREGYRKTPMFISLLRDLLSGEAEVEDEPKEGEPF